ncbi:hypothetical protein O181_031267 [Austropuccinia psidii MF-1]|uniref:Uncharacterized protein n=1 Tax=Austropuccinia psidii MF-1 TaxID=1389203 RepID=A0A9Q3D0B3_9BASI|nr:hypothetical protein [Austropuccinia psidii MF-1]
MITSVSHPETLQLECTPILRQTLDILEQRARGIRISLKDVVETGDLIADCDASKRCSCSYISRRTHTALYRRRHICTNKPRRSDFHQSKAPTFLQPFCFRSSRTRP